MQTRKNQSNLTPNERKAYSNAVLKLKTSVPSQIGLKNRYDDYVDVHMQSMMLPDGSMRMPGWAHRGPAFGPWHRVLLRNFELDLQAIDPSVTIPYWDWTADQSATSGPWTDDFMGAMNPNAAKVISGPFQAGNFVLSILEPGDTDNFLQRALGRTNLGAVSSSLPTAANVQGLDAEFPYDQSPWNQGDNPSFRDRLEGWHGPGSIHNRVHLWVGGSMLPSTSPNDPIFFLHHCNIDRLWAIWQRNNPVQGYEPSDNVANAPQGHRLNDPMQPWGNAITPASALQTSAMGYSYDDFSVPPMALDFRAMAQLPKWKLKPLNLFHLPKFQKMVMFGLSPQDAAAGGHDKDK